MTDNSRSPGEDYGATSDMESSSVSSLPLPSSSQRGRVVGLTAILGALAGTAVLHFDPDIPWQYRFWGTVAIWLATLLPVKVTETIVVAVIERLPWGRGGGGRSS